MITTMERERNEVAPAAGMSGKRGRVYSPAVDVFEEKDRFVVYADIPGADQSGVDITVEKDVLTIKADVSEAPDGRGALRFAEYGIGRYERSFTIGDQVDRDGIEAVVHNGVLRLILRKIPVSIRKVEVRAV